MANINERIKSLSEEELHQAFNEIMEYHRRGSMGDTLVRRIRNEHATEMGIDSLDRNCVFTCGEIMEEIAKRHYGYRD